VLLLQIVYNALLLRTTFSVNNFHISDFGNIFQFDLGLRATTSVETVPMV